MRASNAYQFVSHWRIEGQLTEVADVLADGSGFARWWPSVYLDIKVVEPGDERQVGGVFDLHTKGWLPYTLVWRCTITESRYPFGFSLEASGDFQGRGVWTLSQEGPAVHVVYDWQLRAEKPLLRYASVLLRPLFEANHRWAMARGEESLRLELARRRARSDEERDRVAPPPGPTRFLARGLSAPRGHGQAQPGRSSRS
jgi:hypothetical protein